MNDPQYSGRDSNRIPFSRSPVWSRIVVWMIATTLDAAGQIKRKRRFAVLALLMPLGALWVMALPRYLVVAQHRLAAAAMGQGWAVTPLSQPGRSWPLTLDLGTVNFSTERLTWTAKGTRFIPDLVGGHWMADGPHTATWGALGVVRFTGMIRIDVHPVMAVSSDGLRIEATGAPARVRWEPASFDGGAVTLSDSGAAFGLTTPWAPGMGQAVGAVLTLLARPDRSVTIPLRRGDDTVLAAGLPVLPWPRDSGR